jgi:predicted oxidoreductase (fatty acid repression mutant protein)
MEKTFAEAMKDRRTFYSIGAGSPISDERIQDLVGQAVKYVPSAFHCQSARVVVLFGAAHQKLWSIVMETLRKIVPAEHFGATEEKVKSFAAGHGTVLYFDDTVTTNALMEQYPQFRDNFPGWALQANGMLQFAVWTMLEQEGLGVSLQHYNPLIDDEVRKTWNLPNEWKLIAEMPFGEPTGAPGAKEFLPLDKRMIVLR